MKLYAYDELGAFVYFILLIIIFKIVYAPVSSQMSVTLVNNTQSSILSNSVPTGAAITLEESPAYINSTAVNVLTTAVDGNCKTFNFNIYSYTPSCATTQTTRARLVDVSNGAAVTFGPFTGTCNSYTFPLSASNFGLAPGQAAVSQVFQTELWDSTMTQVWDVKSPGTLNLEGQ